jgi:two-component system nitrogen regulation response regulator NtrX
MRCWSAALGEVWVALPQISGHADDVPEIASMLLAHLAERGEVPLRHFSSGAQNALRLHRWQGEWAELLTTVKNLALSALDEEISAEDVARILQTEVGRSGCLCHCRQCSSTSRCARPGKPSSGCISNTI